MFGESVYMANLTANSNVVTWFGGWVSTSRILNPGKRLAPVDARERWETASRGTARDLHDKLLPSFHGLWTHFQALTNARDPIQVLRSPAVVTSEIANALEILGEELAGRHRAAHGTTTFSVCTEGVPQELNPAPLEEIYKIGGEALCNAFHHARARGVEVEIRYDPRQFRIRVRDDGIGIDASVLSQEGRSGHRGLREMAERAKRVSAQLEVWSAHRAGTEIELAVPASVAYAVHAGRRFRRSEGSMGPK